MDKKSKSAILPSTEQFMMAADINSGSAGLGMIPRPPPARPTRSMSCLDLTLQCIVLQDNKNGSNSYTPSNSISNTTLLNMNQRMSQMKAQKELTSVQMYTQRMVRLRMTQNQRRQILPWFGSTIVVPQGLGYYRVRHRNDRGLSSRSMVVPVQDEYLLVGSLSTPTVPYSTADVVYANEVIGGRSQFSDDVRQSQNNLTELDRNKEIIQQKSKDFDQYPNNRRPSSRSGSKKFSLTTDSATLERDREDPLKNLTSALPLAKSLYHYRQNGAKGNLVKGEQLYLTKSNGALSGREQDHLVTMGTLWSPNNPNQQPSQGTPPLSSSGQQQLISNRTNGISNNSINSNPSKVIQSSGNVNNSLSISNNLLSAQRKYPNNSTSIRPILLQNNGISGRKNSNTFKEQEDPKYTDPLIGASASFQQRIIELGALEGDTVRWERSKRLKKKKQDRDS